MRVQLTRPGGPYAFAAGMVIGLPLCNFVDNMHLGWRPGTALLLGGGTALLAALLVIRPIQAAADEQPGDYLTGLVDSATLRVITRLLLICALLFVFPLTTQILDFPFERWAGTARLAEWPRAAIGEDGARYAVPAVWMIWLFAGVRRDPKQIARTVWFFNLFSIVVLVGALVPFLQKYPPFLAQIEWFGWRSFDADATVGLWLYLVVAAFLAPWLLGSFNSEKRRRAGWVVAAGALLMFLIGVLTMSGLLLGLRLRGTGLTGGAWHATSLVATMRGEVHISKILLVALTATMPLRLATCAIAHLLAPWFRWPVAAAITCACLMASVPWAYRWLGAGAVQPWGEAIYGAGLGAALLLVCLAGIVAAKNLMAFGPRAEWAALGIGAAAIAASWFHGQTDWPIEMMLYPLSLTVALAAGGLGRMVKLR